MECDTTFSGIVYTMYSSSVYNIKLKYSTLPPPPLPSKLTTYYIDHARGGHKKLL